MKWPSNPHLGGSSEEWTQLRFAGRLSITIGCSEADDESCSSHFTDNEAPFPGKRS